MVQAEELRIGNWVNYPTPRRVTGTIEHDLVILDFGKHRKEINCHGIDPIPLTEEWLVKFGFEKGDKDQYIKDGFYLWNHIAPIEFGTAFRVIYGLEGYSRAFLGNVQHVHQLQNLYFALTGEELSPHAGRR